jgi:hypothetical protein
VRIFAATHVWPTHVPHMPAGSKRTGHSRRHFNKRVAASVGLDAKKVCHAAAAADPAAAVALVISKLQQDINHTLQQQRHFELTPATSVAARSSRQQPNITHQKQSPYPQLLPTHNTSSCTAQEHTSAAAYSRTTSSSSSSSEARTLQQQQAQPHARLAPQHQPLLELERIQLPHHIVAAFIQR